jgi:O-antigen/teichoic acid export membrane protein
MIKQIIPKSEFGRNVLTLMTGTTIAQAIPIAISPILTRIYTPEDFGMFALYMSIASILSVIATGRYELAIMLPKKDEDAINIVALSMIIAVFISLISFFIVFIFNTEITNFVGNPEISNWLYFIPITVFITGIYQSFNYWNTRRKIYKIITISKITQSTTTAAASLSLGFSGIGASGLILSGILGHVIATGVLGKIFFIEQDSSTKEIQNKKMIVLGKKYKDFPMVNSFQAFGDTLRESGIIFIISFFFTSASIGFFYLALRVIKNPFSIIGSSISQVFYQKASYEYNQGHDVAIFAKKILLRLIFISLPVMIIIFLFGVSIFSFIFGKEWAISGELVQSLSPWIFMTFIFSPLSQLPLILNKQKSFLLIGLVYNILALAILFVSATLGLNLVQSVFSFSIVLSVYLFFVIIWLFNTLSSDKHGERKISNVV